MRYPKPELDRESAMKLWIEERSEYAKEQVILNNKGIVGLVLKSLNLNPLDEDLFQIGMLGLVKAVNTFDFCRGIKFNTYAARIVRNEILMSLQKKRIIPEFSLDEEYQLNNGENVPYADMIPSKERFEEWSDSEMDLAVFLDGLKDREKKILILLFRGVKQADIASEMGISRSYVSKILRGIRKRWR